MRVRARVRGHETREGVRRDRVHKYIQTRYTGTYVISLWKFFQFDWIGFDSIRLKRRQHVPNVMES